jgi:hypothetical protein
MAKNLIEFDAYSADVVDYNNYNSTKTVLGPDIYKFTGATTSDYYISPNPTTFRDITQDTGVNNWGDIDVIPYTGNTQWLFALKGFDASVATTDIAMYEFDKSNFTYSYVGAISCANLDSSNLRIQHAIKASLNYYTGGTVQVNGTSVTGTSTDWISNRIAVGSRIGFGSNDPSQITQWYRISGYTNMTTPSVSNGAIHCVRVDNSGKIYIGGDFTTYNGVSTNRIARLNSNGTIDTSFSTSGFNSTVRVIKFDSSGKLYVGGDFTQYSGQTNNRIIKLNTDGTKDTSFDNTSGFNSTVYDIQFDSTGSLWVGGAFTTYSGVSSPYLAKLTTGGTRDVSYSTTNSPNTNVNTIAVDNNNDVYIGGNFTQVGAVANNSRYIAKILKTGGTDSTFVVGAAGSSNAFDGVVFTIHYKSSTNTIIAGGSFGSWKGSSNIHLTELSSTGNAIITSASPSAVQPYSMVVDSSNNIYINTNQFTTTKRNINTLTADPNFLFNLTSAANAVSYSNNAMALSPSEDRLYLTTSNTAIDNGIVCVETTGGTRDPNFITTTDYISQRISLNSSAGVFSTGTPYVIEELKLFTYRTGTGPFMIQGLAKQDFTISPTSIVTPVFNYAALSKGMYELEDCNYTVARGPNYVATFTNTIKDNYITGVISANTQYLYVINSTGRIARFNIKSPTINQIGDSSGRIKFNTFSQLIESTNAVLDTTGSAPNTYSTGKFTISTMQSGSAQGVESFYMDGSGVIQSPIESFSNEATLSFSVMSEVPPGSTTTYAAAGNVGRVYYMPEIDRLIVLNTSTTAKSYITGYRTNLQQPTLVSTFYGRETYNNLAYENSFDLAFLFNGGQLQGNTSNANAPKYPDTLGTGFFGSVCNGVLHLCRPLNTIQNNLYSVPLSCEAKYVDTSNNVFISPKYTLPNVISITGLFVNTLKEYGSYPFALPPEPIVIDYRTTGIDDNSGSWTTFTSVEDLNNDIICEGVLDDITIQFRFSYKVAGNTCLVNRIYGFSLLYEDDRTDSHYSPSVAKTNLNNRIFAWRQDSLWNGNIPDLKLRLYNSTNNNIVFYDTVSTSSSGTWEYSTDGNTWQSWASSADTVGNYIRYVADFVPSGIKLRVGLNKI